MSPNEGNEVSSGSTAQEKRNSRNSAPRGPSEGSEMSPGDRSETAAERPIAETGELEEENSGNAAPRGSSEGSEMSPDEWKGTNSGYAAYFQEGRREMAILNESRGLANANSEERPIKRNGHARKEASNEIEMSQDGDTGTDSGHDTRSQEEVEPGAGSSPCPVGSTEKIGEIPAEFAKTVLEIPPDYKNWRPTRNYGEETPIQGENGCISKLLAYITPDEIMTQQKTIQDLPNEMLEHICTYLNLKETSRLSATTKRLRTITNTNGIREFVDLLNEELDENILSDILKILKLGKWELAHNIALGIPKYYKRLQKKKSGLTGLCIAGFTQHGGRIADIVAILPNLTALDESYSKFLLVEAIAKMLLKQSSIEAINIGTT